jgi:uncharacterized membrane protein
MPDASSPAASSSAAASSALHFDALLTPHRSLGRTGFTLLMTAISVASFAAGFGFWWLGAWPVCGFMGLDVALIYTAFRLSYRAARLAETVQLSDSELLVRRVRPGGQAETWRFQPYWVRVIFAEQPTMESQITLASHGREVTIGSFLALPERIAFAAALRDALRRHKTAANF